MEHTYTHLGLCGTVLVINTTYNSDLFSFFVLKLWKSVPHVPYVSVNLFFPNEFFVCIICTVAAYLKHKHIVP